MPTLECPACQTPVLSDDHFCEVCGTALNPDLSLTPAPTVAPTVATTSAMLADRAGCTKCGAPVAAIDADGYCGQCGFRYLVARLPQEFDHVAVTLSPTFAGVSDRGRSHHQNEDFFAIDQCAANQILVVCDGVSSSTAPQTASHAAAQAACQALRQSLTGDALITADQMQAAIQQAQTAVASLPAAQSVDPPSSTIVAAIVQNGMATIGWLGDSRAYWIGTDRSQVLTTDHSWLNEQLSSSQITAADAHRNPNAHAITRWLGADAEVEPAQTMDFAIPGAGYLVLCSDGLWNYLSDADHLATLIAGGGDLAGNSPIDSDAPTIAQRLVDYANAQGGKDNITVAVLSLQ
jgi:PPM family protein phosphatase